jgi:uncharacterized repeat protein (TIGR01451 family)
MKHIVTTAFLLTLLVGGSVAQPNPLLVPARPPSVAPLMYIRFAEPDGMDVTFYQGRAQPRTFKTPFTIGIRPGYVYRIKLSNIPDYPGLVLVPTLDVRGSLCLPPQTGAAKHPAPFILTRQDFDHVIDNSVITKLVFLEDPETAVPEQGKKGGLILENEVSADKDLLTESRYYGRPIFGWRLGSRLVDEAELTAQSVQGTILFPGENFIPPAAIRPYVPFQCIPFFDPLLGPAHPREECLQDGGDVGNKAGIGPDGRLYGLDPSDTVAEFTDSCGRRQVTVSNRVCICVPRFGALRSEILPEAAQSNLVPGAFRIAEAGAGIRSNVPSETARQSEGPGAFRGRERPSAWFNQDRLAKAETTMVLRAVDLQLGVFEYVGTAAVQQLTQEQRLFVTRQIERAAVITGREGVQAVSQKEGTYVIGQVQGLASASQIVSTCELTLTCEDICPALPDKPLVLRKWIKEHDAQVGDVVTFFLRYSNAGGQPIDNIVVSDSLTNRLEFVSGSAKSDRAAVFTTQQNEAGSVILRWELQGRLPACESGTVSFQARIR